MLMNVFEGILIPFVGTTLGAACVFFMRKTLSKLLQRALAGFAAGIMVAASIWSLLIPAIEQSENMGTLSFVPAVVGFWIGILFLLALDHLIPHLHVGSDQTEGPKSKLGRTTMMVLAVTLHNIPEGMAVGVMYADFLLKMHRLQQQVHSFYHLELPFRIFRKERLYPCRLGQRAKARERHFSEVYFQEWLNRLEQY